MNLKYNDFLDALLEKELEDLFESFDPKDATRIQDFFTKSGGDMSKIISLANSMANKITDVNKAVRRAEAALSVMSTPSGGYNPVAEIFYSRAVALGYPASRVPSMSKSGSTPASAPSTPATPAPSTPATPPPSTPPTPKVDKPKPAPKTLTPEPTEEPASKLSKSERYHPSENPYANARSFSNAVKLNSVGNVNFNTGKNILNDQVIEVWEILTLSSNMGDYAVIFNDDTAPSCPLGTKAHFSLNGKNLFLAEMVDYVKSKDVRGLIDLYGESANGFSYL